MTVMNPDLTPRILSHRLDSEVYRFVSFVENYMQYLLINSYIQSTCILLRMTCVSDIYRDNDVWSS